MERQNSCGGITVQLKGISCIGLKSSTLFRKPHIYAVVSVAGAGGDRRRRKHQQQQRTPVDKNGGRNPEWMDLEMRLDLDCDSSSFLDFDLVVCGGGLLPLGDQVVGQVHVPIQDLAAAGDGAGVGFRSLRYLVRSSHGKPAGDLTFYFRVSSRPDGAAVHLPPQKPTATDLGGFVAPGHPISGSYLPYGGYYAPPTPPTPAKVDYFRPPPYDPVAYAPPPPPAPVNVEYFPPSPYDPVTYAPPPAGGSLMYYYCCPAPPPVPDPCRFPSSGYDFVAPGGGYFR